MNDLNWHSLQKEIAWLLVAQSGFSEVDAFDFARDLTEVFKKWYQVQEIEYVKKQSQAAVAAAPSSKWRTQIDQETWQAFYQTFKIKPPDKKTTGS